MLVLSRMKNQSVVINNDITITVLEIRGDRVRLGIVAPRDIPVHRQEVWAAIHEIDAGHHIELLPACAPEVVFKDLGEVVADFIVDMKPPEPAATSRFTGEGGIVR